MTLGMEEGNLLLTVLGVLAAIGSAIYTWIATKDKDNSQHIKAVETALSQALADHSSRLDKVETALLHLPTQNEISELQGDMKAVKEAQQGVRSELAGVKSSVDRMFEFLLNNK